MKLRFLLRIALSLVVFAALSNGRAADLKEVVVPDAEYPKLVDFSSQVIREALKGKPEKRLADKAQLAALMIAAYAQQNLDGANGQQRATVRDAALEMAALIRAKKYAEALKLLEALPTLRANPKAKKEKAMLFGMGINYEDTMVQFRQPARGGLGIGGQLEDLGANPDGKLADKELTPQLATTAYLTAIVGELIKGYVPENKLKVKEWQTYAHDMRQQAIALAEAAKGKDGKAAFQALTRLNQTCEKCHKAFR